MKRKNLPLKIAVFCLLVSFGNSYAQDFNTIIKNHISSKSEFKKQDLKTFEIINTDYSESMKSDVVKIQQTYNDIPLYGAVATALVKDGRLKFFADNFSKNYGAAAKTITTTSDKSTFSKISKLFNINDSSVEFIGMNDTEKEGTKAIKSRVVYFQNSVGDLKLGYEFMFEEPGTSNYWDVVADSSTGEILSKINLTLSCNFHDDAFSHDFSDAVLSEIPNQQKNSTEEFKLVSAAYNVFPLPIESPTHGARTIVTNPWFLDASPDGWQTVPGIPKSQNYTITRGNNVHAYEDRAAKNLVGYSPDGGTGYNFDFTFTPDATAMNLDAAITNLFYVNNKIHDIFYRLGFDEAARNFQAYNYGKSGAENDYVLAEAQDGSGTNNANFATPKDGTKPRMQMYLFDPPFVKRFYYNTPPEAVSREVKNYISTTFGPALTTVGVTGDVILSPVLDGCTPLPAGALLGKIGLVERGTCNFTTKVKNVQDAGAIAAIIYNRLDSTPTSGMSGTDATITIPSVLIENDEAVYLKGLLSNNKNVNVTLKYDESIQKFRDASFDNGIIVHEYGHGISNRNTGDGYTCLSSTNSKEQMGEGWSDFFALMLTNQPGDNATVARGIGTYASTQPISGNGIRPAKYSPNFAVNNYTYARTNGMEYTNSANQVVPDVHSIGFIWATMLWDLHWKYVEKYGYASDVMSTMTNGSTRVLQLVTNALKLQECSPTFVSGRDAILAAEQALTLGEDKCMIWNVFAKRGLGVNASAGSKTNINDQVEDFTTPAECLVLATNEANNATGISIFPNPAKNEFYLKSSKNIFGKIDVDIYDIAGRMVSSQKVSTSDAISTEALGNGVYIVKVNGLGVNYSTKLIVKK